MSALARYIASDVARSQRWLPPFITFVVICLVNLAMDGAAPGNALPTFADAGAALLPIAIWMTVIVGNCEDPVQVTITVATVGSETRVRLAKLLVAYAACGALAVMSMAMAWPATGASFADVGAGLAAHLIAAAVGTAVGAWCMRPVLDRGAWAVLIAVFVSLGEILVPHFPPDRQLLVLLEAARPARLAGSLAMIALEALLISSVLVAGAVRFGRRRT
jgi:hypothetical protein